MCHKEWEMGTMVEKMQPVSRANFLYNIAKVFVNTSNAFMPSRLEHPFFPNMKAPVFAGGYP